MSIKIANEKAENVRARAGIKDDKIHGRPSKGMAIDQSVICYGSFLKDAITSS